MPTNEYMRQYMADRRQKRRQNLIDLSGGRCEKCGSDDNLEFNHLDRFEKKFVLSGCHLDKAWNTVLEEHAKCELLCRTCHLKYTQMQFDTGQLATGNKNTDPQVHGSPRCYTETGCRCELCRAAKKAYRAKEIRYTEVLAIGTKA